MSCPVLFFVNPGTRMCRALSGPPDGQDHIANVFQASKDGFIQVTEGELDDFREVTASAKAAGWNPSRMRYDTWLKKQGAKP
ncbi:hypothetical protein [Pseudomonas sp. AU8050]|jgi:hypothetical protein|uniref:hypothetical protein n=1 Tax=Pseudomonas sp. AU8050 TaxID=2681497 RepID=UPI00140E1B1E|nr:hypothetical protein [Pseudomonas sp. AU8050]NHC53095.1 hypothetical protein [Pseudomonas sp. AU8050]